MCDPQFQKRVNDASMTTVNLHSEQVSPAILLPSLTTRIARKMSSRNYRILFNRGSHQITIETCCQLGCQLLQIETVTIGVFGGHKMQKTMIRVSILKKKNKNTKELIVIEALEEEDICSEHVSIPDDEVTRKMKETR